LNLVIVTLFLKKRSLLRSWLPQAVDHAEFEPHVGRVYLKKKKRLEVSMKDWWKRRSDREQGLCPTQYSL